MRLANLGIFSLPANSWTGARTRGLDYASSLFGDPHLGASATSARSYPIHFFLFLEPTGKHMRTLGSVLHKLQILGEKPMNEQVGFPAVSVYFLSVGAWEHEAADGPWTPALP